jgi:hypothetical protein
MEQEISKSFGIHFSKLTDYRIKRKKLYPLVEILFVVLCGSICGAESWRDFVLFGKEKIDFLRRYFPFVHGIPSTNTFARLFYVLEPGAFKACFLAWVKTLCNSVDELNDVPAIRMVSAFATETRLVLAQQKVDDKSNEITAIPLLLDLLNLKGNIITIDALGCVRPEKVFTMTVTH